MRSGVEEPKEDAPTDSDEWGRDPSVRVMRRVFAAMEGAQKKLMKDLGLSPFDQRLRRWRERALAAFDASWARSAGGDLELSEAEAGVLYVHCLGRIIAREGVEIPFEILPRSEKVQKILREVFP